MKILNFLKKNTVDIVDIITIIILCSVAAGIDDRDLSGALVFSFLALSLIVDRAVRGIKHGWVVNINAPPRDAEDE